MPSEYYQRPSVPSVPSEDNGGATAVAVSVAAGQGEADKSARPQPRPGQAAQSEAAALASLDVTTAADVASREEPQAKRVRHRV